MCFTKGDRWTVLFIVAAAIFLYAAFSISVFSTGKKTVEVMVDSKPYAVYNLEEISGAKTIEIETELGKNVVEITKDGARMIEASCLDKLDVKCGKITKPNQVIVCIPNRVTVVLKSDKNNEIDKVTY